MSRALAPGPEPDGINPLDAIRILRRAGGALFEQSLLHGQLARIEIDVEKHRLTRMLLVTLVGFACLLCGLLFAGGTLLMSVWETGYRVHAGFGLAILFASGTLIAWRRFRFWSAMGGNVFAASREELAADAALLQENS